MQKTLLITTALFLGAAGAASAQDACSKYTVQPGDSLSAIAKAAFGSINYQRIYDANRNEIGRNPNVLSVGAVLALPCADGSLPGEVKVTVQEAAPKPAETPKVEVATPAKKVESIRLVTGTGYKPFTDETMEGGGIYTQLVRAAMETVDSEYKTSINFVNDWGSHLDTLLPTQSFDGAFPWLSPKCDQPDTLSDDSKFRCDEFLHSDPFYEVINGLFVMEGNPLATSEDYADFKGTTICLPEGYTDAVLASNGLAEPAVTYFRPKNAEACFFGLIAGDVDVVSLELRQAEDAAKRVGVASRIATNPNLTDVNVLSVFVAKNHPNGEEVIEALNTGLANLRNSGEWFEIVSAGMSKFYSAQN